MGATSATNVQQQKGYKIMATQLQALAKKIPPKWISTLPTGYGARYCSHAAVQQMLLATLGPTGQRVDQILYNDGVITGVLLTMTFTIDGETVEITEAGDCDRPKPDNNGANMKNAISDAVKRCAMRVGKGLQLWCEDDDHYILDRVLAEKAGEYEEV